MKKIIISLSIIAIVAVVSIGITTAYFTDTETSENNTMAAGTMDLNVNDADSSVITMTLNNKAPGDFGTEPTGGDVTLKNAGSLDGELDIAMGVVTNYPCTDTTYGKHDETEYCTSADGTLGANAEIAPYVDVDQDGDYDNGTDIGLKSNGTIYVSGVLDYDAIDNYSEKVWKNIYTGLMAVNAEDDFVIDWQIPTTAGNGIQGDDVKFDVIFLLKQAGDPDSL